jgi:hypothetical protein
MTHVLRSIVYDAGFENPEQVISALNLHPVSAEVSEMERRDSGRRLTALDPLAPFIGISSALLAKATVAYTAQEMEMSEEIREALTDQFQRLALGSILSTLASLNDIGLIHIAGIAVGVGSTDKGEE